MPSEIIAALGGGVQPRLEINTFVQNDRQFSLYVQALTQMQQIPQNDFSSFFQVGGIHGLPFTEYDGSTGQNGFTANPSNQWAGYCTHGSALFPTWHRPYVMLIEQIIYQHAQQIAGTYTTSDRQDWIDAATTLRQPYWDWAENIVPPQQVINMTEVTITMSDGSKKSVTNPLMQYTFHPIDPSFPLPYSQWDTTLRQPSGQGSNAKTDVGQLVHTLQNSQPATTQNTYSMLTRIHDWKKFSNHDPTYGSANSIESIHDNIHVLVGGNGDMSDPSVAAFDPIFFLHHANVDRLISLWSAVNPGVWIDSGNAGGGTFTMTSGESVNAQTPLTPFWKSQTDYWLSNEVTDTTSLGYTYPELSGSFSSVDAKKEAIAKKINDLYGPGSTKSSKGNSKSSPSKPSPSHAPTTNNNHKFGGLPLGGKHSRGLLRALKGRGLGSRLGQLLGGILGGGGGSYSDWTIRVEVDRSEVSRSFSVIFFLGSVPEDPSTWLTCDQFIGAHHAFVNSVKCTACDKNSMLEEGFVSLNGHIADNTDLLSFASHLVAPLLTQQLQWRALSTDGTVLNLSSLNVTVLEVPLSLSPGAYLPDVGNIVPWHNITQGRTGGGNY